MSRRDRSLVNGTAIRRPSMFGSGTKGAAASGMTAATATTTPPATTFESDLDMRLHVPSLDDQNKATLIGQLVKILPTIGILSIVLVVVYDHLLHTQRESMWKRC